MNTHRETKKALAATTAEAKTAVALKAIQLPPTEAQLKARAFEDTVMADALARAVREGVLVRTDQVQWSARTGRFEPFYRSLIQ
jgi:hypothetical protein